MPRKSNLGKGWETALDHQHRAYRREQVACIFHAHPAIEGGHLQKAPPDYFGVVEDLGGTSGIPVLFDAKAHQGTRWPFSKLAEHQARDLEAWKDRGGVAAIALKLGATTWWVNWLELGPLWWAWREKEDGARASVDLHWLRGYAEDLKGWTDCAAVL